MERYNYKNKTKCDFCRFYTGTGCMVKPSYYYCKDANNEYYQYINGLNSAKAKSLRKWDK